MDALFVFDRTSAGDKQSLRWEDSEALFGMKKTVILPNALWNAFFFL